MGINLNLEKQRGVLLKSKVIPKAALAVSVILSVWLSIFVSLRWDLNRKKQVLQKFEEKNRIYVSLKNKITFLEKEQENLLKEKKLLDTFLGQPFFWSEKISTLADALPEEAWLRRVAFNKEREAEILKISGFLFSAGEERKPLTILNQFIKALRENPSFFQHFSEINMVDAKTTQSTGGTSSGEVNEILEFNLELPLKK